MSGIIFTDRCYTHRDGEDQQSLESEYQATHSFPLDHSGSESHPAAQLQNSNDKIKWRRMPKGINTKGVRVNVCSVIHNDISCGKVFTRKEHLRRHLRNVHGFSDLDACLQLSKHAEQQHPPRYATSLTKFKPSKAITFGARQDSEGELIHHYLNRAEHLYLNPGFDACHTGLYWMESITQVISCSDQRLDLVLSIAAAHMASLQPAKTQAHRSLMDSSVKYHLKAITAHRLAVQSLLAAKSVPTKEGLDALWFVTVMLITRAWITIRDDVRNGVSDEQLFSDLFVHVELTVAFNPAMTLLVPYSGKTDAQRIIINPQVNSTVTPPLTGMPTPSFPQTIYLGTLAQRLFHMMRFTEQSAVRLPAYLTTFNIIDFLYSAYSDYQYMEAGQPSLIELLSTGRSNVPTYFVPSLHTRRPIALVILAHFMLFEDIPELSSIWWLGGEGILQREVECLNAFLPESWQWAMEGPRRVARGQMTLRELIMTDSNMLVETDDHDTSQ